MKSFCLTTYENNVITNRFMNFKSRGHHSFLHEVFAFIHLYVFLDSNVRFLSFNHLLLDASLLTIFSSYSLLNSRCFTILGIFFLACSIAYCLSSSVSPVPSANNSSNFLIPINFIISSMYLNPLFKMGFIIHITLAPDDWT